MNSDDRVSSVQDKISEVRARLQALHGGGDGAHHQTSVLSDVPFASRMLDRLGNHTSASMPSLLSPRSRPRREAPPPQPIVVQFSPEADKIAQQQLRKIQDQSRQIAALQQEVGDMRSRQEAVTQGRQPVVRSAAPIDYSIAKGDVHMQHSPGVTANRAPPTAPATSQHSPPNVASLTFAEMQALLRAKLRGEAPASPARPNHVTQHNVHVTPSDLREVPPAHYRSEEETIEVDYVVDRQGQPQRVPQQQQQHPDSFYQQSRERRQPPPPRAPDSYTTEGYASSADDRHARSSSTPAADDVYEDEDTAAGRQVVYRPREAFHTSAAPLPAPSAVRRLPPPSDDQRHHRSAEVPPGRPRRAAGDSRPSVSPPREDTAPRHLGAPPREAPAGQWTAVSGAEVFAVLRLRGVITSQGVTGEHLLPPAHCHTMQLTTGEHAQLLQLRELLAAAEATSTHSGREGSGGRPHRQNEGSTSNGSTPLRSKSPSSAQSAFEKHRHRMQAVREARERRAAGGANASTTVQR